MGQADNMIKYKNLTEVVHIMSYSYKLLEAVEFSDNTVVE